VPVTFKSEEVEFWKKYPYDVGELHFPRDEGKHDFNREWWYINLHLTNLSSGKKYDVMASYFPKQKDLQKLLLERSMHLIKNTTSAFGSG